jgi:hypothetical protein
MSPTSRRFDRTLLGAAADAQAARLEAAGLALPSDGAHRQGTDPEQRVIAAVGYGIREGIAAEPSAMRFAVRLLADRLAQRHPGRSVEVRIPPYAAVQCIAGPRHTRGTPPNVVETDPATFVGLACGFVTWDAATADGRVRASGERADLRPYLPLDVQLPDAAEP